MYETPAVNPTNSRCAGCVCVSDAAWPQSPCGQTSHLPCSPNASGFVTRACTALSGWLTPDNSGCASKQLQLVLANINAIPASESLNALSKAVADTTVLGQADVDVVQNVLSYYESSLRDGSTASSSSAIPVVARILDKLVEMPQATLDSVVEQGNSQRGSVATTFSITNLPLTSDNYDGAAKSMFLWSIREVVGSTRASDVSISSWTNPTTHSLVVGVKVRAYSTNDDALMIELANPSLLCSQLALHSSLLFNGSVCRQIPSDSPRFYPDGMTSGIDNIMKSLASSVSPGQAISFVSDSMEMHVFTCNNSNSDFSLSLNRPEYSLSLPSTLLRAAKAVTVFFFRDTRLFSDSTLSSSGRSLTSKILAVSLTGADSSKVPPFEFSLQ